MAMAVQEIFPGTKIAIGPAIKDGFYYDFFRKDPFTPEDLEKIEKKMKEIVEKNEPTRREVWQRKKVKDHYKKIGEIFHEHWKIKKKLSKYISNSKLDRIYLNLLKEKSFIGGKLIGAGGGGFYLMVTEDINSSIKYLKSRKINFTKLKFVKHGPNRIREESWR